jgi:hypothetical protein
VWSQRLGRRLFQLAGQQHGASLSLPHSVSTRDLHPHLGRTTRGSAALAYVRCGTRSTCRAYLWSFTSQHEQQLRFPVARGCQPVEVAAWQTVVAYIVASAHTQPRCRYRDEGLWVSHGRRLTHTDVDADGIGDLRGTTTLWDAFDGDAEIVRVATVGGRTRELNYGGFANTSGIALDEEFAYWWTVYEDVPTLTRQRLATPRDCQISAEQDEFLPQFDRTFDLHLGVDHGRIFYAMERGIFPLDHHKLHWHRGCH